MMATEPSPQTLFWNVTPRRPAPAAHTVEQATEPGSKRHDPLPSFLAAESLKATGTWHKQLWIVYHGVRRFPGCTAVELTQRLGLEDKYIASRRLPELRDRFGCICNGPQRRCTVSPAKHLSQTWFCSRRFFDDKSNVHRVVSAPMSAAQQRTSPASEAGEPDPVLTVDERRRFRERLSAEGSPETKRFLNGLRDRGGA